jgi:hypothetical protein
MKEEYFTVDVHISILCTGGGRGKKCESVGC